MKKNLTVKGNMNFLVPVSYKCRHQLNRHQLRSSLVLSNNGGALVLTVKDITVFEESDIYAKK